MLLLPSLPRLKIAVPSARVLLPTDSPTYPRCYFLSFSLRKPDPLLDDVIMQSTFHYYTLNKWISTFVWASIRLLSASFMGWWVPGGRGLEWGEPVSGFAHSCLLRADFRAWSHTLLRGFMKKQICHDLWRIEVHPWISLYGFLITIMAAAEKLWALLAKMPACERRLHVAGRLWKASQHWGNCSRRQRSRCATRPQFLCSRDRWRLEVLQNAFEDHFFETTSKWNWNS